MAIYFHTKKGKLETAIIKAITTCNPKPQTIQIPISSESLQRATIRIYNTPEQSIPKARVLSQRLTPLKYSTIIKTRGIPLQMRN